MRRCVLLSLVFSVVLTGCDGTAATPVGPEATISLTTNTATGAPQGDVTAVFPSTNELNAAKTPVPWAHVLFVDVGVEQVTLDFVSARSFASCFEYRIDNGASTGAANFNAAVTDGLWQFLCVTNNTSQQVFGAKQYVDIRSAFGAEADERFDWTRFYVLSLENKDQCKAGDWEALGFKNQGQCVRYVETGFDSRTGS